MGEVGAEEEDVKVEGRQASLQLWFGGHSMDPPAPNKQVSPDLARESLMAISQAVPENPLPIISVDANVGGMKDNGNAEDYRSKLISISYTQPPEAQPQPLPPAPGKISG